MSNMENLERIRLITRHYDQLQGLRQAPFGLMFLVMAVWKGGWWPWFEKWQPLSGLAVVGLALVASWLVGQYYARTFGRVQRQNENKRLEIVISVIFLAGLYLGGIAEYEWQWPVSGTGLFTAVVLVAYFFMTGSFRFHYLVLAALMAAVSLLPLLRLLPPEQVYLFGPEGAVGVALFGLIWLVGGLVDHWLLVRSLPDRGQDD